MLDFLRMLAPQSLDALRPASGLRRAMEDQALPTPLSPRPAHDPSAALPQRHLSQPSQSNMTAADIAPAMQTELERRHRTASAAIATGTRPRSALSDAFDETHRKSSRAPLLPAPTQARIAAGADTSHSVITDHVADDGIRPPKIVDTSSAIQPPSVQRPVDRTMRGQSLQPPTHRSHPDHTAAPLSPMTVAVYAQSPASGDVAPALHITIDRIEVRAPASASRPAASRRRDVAPTQALGDYLRGRDKARS